MGKFWDEVAKAFEPHVAAMNQTAVNIGTTLDRRLSRIEDNLGDLGRPDLGDKWFRLQVISKEFLEEEPTEIGTVPINQIWTIQSVVVDGVFNKSPAFVILSGGYIIGSVLKEGVGSENFGGDAVCMGGEVIQVRARATGKITVCLNVVRRTIQEVRRPENAAAHVGGMPSQPTIGKTTHDPARDIIESDNGEWVQTETDPAGQVGLTRVGGQIVGSP